MVGARFPVGTCVLVDRTLLGGCDSGEDLQQPVTKKLNPSLPWTQQSVDVVLRRCEPTGVVDALDVVGCLVEPSTDTSRVSHDAFHQKPHFFQQTGPMPRSTLIGSSSAAEHTPQMLVVLPTI